MEREEEAPKNCFEITQVLIELGADIEAANKDNHTPLVLAAHSGNIQAAEALIAAGAGVDPLTYTGETPLSIAVKRMNVPLAKLFLDNGANVKPLLLDAMAKHDFKLVQNYALCGVDLSTNLGTITLLHYSASMNMTKMASLLLKWGVPVDQRTDRLNETALHLAAEEGFLSMVKLLLQHGANVNVKDVRGWTPLRYAYMSGNPLVIERLEKAGAVM